MKSKERQVVADKLVKDLNEEIGDLAEVKKCLNRAYHLAAKMIKEVVVTTPNETVSEPVSDKPEFGEPITDEQLAEFTDKE